MAVRKVYSPAVYDALAQRMIECLQMDNSHIIQGGSSSSMEELWRDFVSHDDLVMPFHLSIVPWAFAKQVRHHSMSLHIRQGVTLGKTGC